MGMGWLSQTQHSHYSLVGDQNTVRFLKALKVVKESKAFESKVKSNNTFTYS